MRDPPVLDAVTKGFEADLEDLSESTTFDRDQRSTHPGIANVVGDDFLLVEPSAVTIVEALREIPMIERLMGTRVVSCH